MESSDNISDSPSMESPPQRPIPPMIHKDQIYAFIIKKVGVYTDNYCAAWVRQRGFPILALNGSKSSFTIKVKEIDPDDEYEILPISKNKAIVFKGDLESQIKQVDISSSANIANLKLEEQPFAPGTVY